MIEVEKKFTLTKEQERKLVDGAMLINEKTFVDVYYDAPQYGLTTKDWWLRRRDETFELKIRPRNIGVQQMCVYEEISDETEIRRRLGLVEHGSLSQDLINAGYEIMVVITTHRRTYQKDAFTLVFDTAT